jgi:hypothetical protein
MVAHIYQPIKFQQFQKFRGKIKIKNKKYQIIE